MRTGLTVSAIGHAGLVVLAIVGVGMTRPLDAPPVESISVDLISVEEFSNIRRGVLKSTVVETEAPSVVETEAPAELAQPTGNTEEDQPTPEDTPDPTPAPTQETAPEPVPVAEPVVEQTPEPLPEPDVQPEPAPEPDPVPVPEPVSPEPELATPEVTEAPADVAPRPVMRTAAIDEKRAAFKKLQEDEKKKRENEAKKQQEEERVREAKRQEDEAARLADEVANIINSEKSRGATTGAGGEATLGKETGTAARLTQSEMDALVAKIRGCLSVPLGAAEAGVTARLAFRVDAAGEPSAPTLLVAPASPLEQAYASAAQRAVQRCRPYPMATGQEIRALFDARQF